MPGETVRSLFPLSPLKQFSPFLAGSIHQWSVEPNVGGVYFSGFILVTSIPRTCFPTP